MVSNVKKLNRWKCDFSMCVFEKVEWIGTKIAGVVNVFMSICNFAVMAVIFLTLIMRAIAGINFDGYEEVVIVLAMWLYMLGSTYGSYKRSQIKADILNASLKDGKLKDGIQILADVVTLVIGIIFIDWCVEDVSWLVEKDVQTSVWHIPSWISEASFGSV